MFKRLYQHDGAEVTEYGNKFSTDTVEMKK